MELYIITNLGFKELANTIDANIEALKYQQQERDGLNIGGGKYILFTKDDCEVALIKNQGEVVVSEMSDFNYYLWEINGSGSKLAPFETALTNAGILHEKGDFT